MLREGRGGRHIRDVLLLAGLTLRCESLNHLCRRGSGGPSPGADAAAVGPITIPSVMSDLLILVPSISRWPDVPDLATCAQQAPLPHPPSLGSPLPTSATGLGSALPASTGLAPATGGSLLPHLHQDLAGLLPSRATLACVHKSYVHGDGGLRRKGPIAVSTAVPQEPVQYLAARGTFSEPARSTRFMREIETTPPFDPANVPARRRRHGSAKNRSNATKISEPDYESPENQSYTIRSTQPHNAVVVRKLNGESM